MKISDQLMTIENTLKLWVSPIGGVAFKVHDLRHMWEQAAAKSDKPRVMIAYAGESSMGDESVQGVLSRVKRKFAVLVTRGKGFTADRGATILDFADIVEDCREQCRGIAGISDEPPVDFAGIRPYYLSPEIPADAFLIEFWTSTDIGQWGPNPS
jgi:hypothetical protein